MPYDADLLKTVIEDHGVAVIRLAERAGYDDKTVYRYLLGERTLPSNVIRAAFELTHDIRLLGLVAGVVPIAILCSHCVARAQRGGQGSSVGEGQGSSLVPPVARPLRVPPLSQALSTVLEAVERAARSGRYMQKIAADGKFTEADVLAAEKFERDAGDAQSKLALAAAAVRCMKEAVEK
jgi:hypothetical protein